MADVLAPSALDGLLGRDEAAQRRRLLDTHDAFSASLRLMEAELEADPAWLAEAWHWVLFLTVVRGFRGLTTGDTYVRHLTRFAGYVLSHGLDYTALTVEQVDAWQKWLYLYRHTATVSRRLALTAVRSFYRWRATRLGAVDVTAGYPVPKRWGRAPRKYTAEDLRKLFRAARESYPEPGPLRDTTLLLLLFTTGLRREEIATLTVDQLELGERTGLVRCIGKGAKERTIPIEGPIVAKLTEWLLARSELPVQDDTVFVQVSKNRRGAKLTVRAVEMIVERCAKRAGLKEWGVHRFRITFATTQYDDGADIERIRVLMGHESIETTRRYLAVSSRMNRCRLKSYRQHAALGTIPAGMPLWAQAMEKNKHAPAGVF